MFLELNFGECIFYTKMMYINFFDANYPQADISV